MLEIITPSGIVGWINWDFFAKSVELGDQYMLGVLKKMIGFSVADQNRHYYCGELDENLQLQYFYNGAYESLAIPPQSTIFYSKEELLEMLCEQYEKATNETISHIMNKKIKTDKQNGF